MFQVRIFTPAVTNEDGWPHAGGELRIGEARLRFLVDLSHWSIAQYERQWRDGIRRLAHGAPSAALMIAYRGESGEAHRVWALWREGDHVYVQEQTVLVAELDAPFDPFDPHGHVGVRVPASEQALPIGEWRGELIHLLATAFGIRWPMYPG